MRLIVFACLMGQAKRQALSPRGTRGAEGVPQVLPPSRLGELTEGPL